MLRSSETGTPDFALSFAGHAFVPHAAGALYWESERTLLVADLHLEKGAAYARRGQMLPPYDSRTTLRRLAQVIAHFDPACIVALGDSFHTSEVAEALGPEERSALAKLQRGRDWIWITGNHDPEIPTHLGGSVATELAVNGITLRHEPSPQSAEIAGHLHPIARVVRQGQAIRRKCFATDGNRLVMPAFGAYSGGLDVMGRAFAGLFDRESLAVWLMGKDRVYPFHGRALAG
ncbi:ligase-associated DNA damage response endonuclease PdeM [Methyloligella sp. 2.7D]|uniref:ligase-associated DNA damage response endonuclease PdeM n=1 Tax=unclassified Methyloligella TaxID=2625955 RepID=UPI00157BC804|nr:ligase-associated DNA damage response endonuclease PdeM [Methyloligella sp. GL2]QKP78483.1 ligase-associated DNA damage response endonuclease PdeM [Methyloligella sp. GL2]